MPIHSHGARPRKADSRKAPEADGMPETAKCESEDAEVSDGDIVVAVIENSATVKKIKRLEDMIVLYPQSSNPIHQPIFLGLDFNGLINGKVVKVLENPAI